MLRRDLHVESGGRLLLCDLEGHSEEAGRLPSRKANGHKNVTARENILQEQFGGNGLWMGGRVRRTENVGG
jgi:hypothetical protein